MGKNKQFAFLIFLEEHRKNVCRKDSAGREIRSTVCGDSGGIIFFLRSFSSMSKVPFYLCFIHITMVFSYSLLFAACMHLPSSKQCIQLTGGVRKQIIKLHSNQTEWGGVGWGWERIRKYKPGNMANNMQKMIKYIRVLWLLPPSLTLSLFRSFFFNLFKIKWRQPMIYGTLYLHVSHIVPPSTKSFCIYLHRIFPFNNMRWIFRSLMPHLGYLTDSKGVSIWNGWLKHFLLCALSQINVYRSMFSFLFALSLFSLYLWDFDTFYQDPSIAR